MFGSNYFGQPYFGQGYAKAGAIFAKALSATVTTVASLSSRIAIHGKALIATVVTVAKLPNKTVNKILKATQTTSATLVSSFFHSLKKLVNASTKYLNGIRQSKALSGFNRTTKRII